mmetsp:Transcript_36592/g.105192  ORF Transcript_36592/g.105192 Transcript_36592/m.105192 type:complete len:364 (+) Transcript_36592:104-1195(+)
MPRRPRWADLRDSSNETFAGTLRNSSPPCADTLDSYCETPDPFDRDLAENSQASLNMQLGRGGAFGVGPPKDFAFLLGGAPQSLGSPAGVAGPPNVSSEVDASFGKEVGGSVGSVVLSASLDGLRLRGAAGSAGIIEDIALGRQEGPSDFSFLLGARGDGDHRSPSSSLDDDASIEHGVAAKVGAVAGADAGGVGGRSITRRRPARKRRHANSQAPAEKRLCGSDATNLPLGESVGVAVLAEEDGGCFANSTSAGIASGGEAVERSDAGQQAQPSQMDEDSLLHRLEKRKALIGIIKQSPEYRNFDLQRRGGVATPEGVDCPAPCTPDGSDPSISKRRWEEEVRLWRSALRQRLVGRPLSTAQ